MNRITAIIIAVVAVAIGAYLFLVAPGGDGATEPDVADDPSIIVPPEDMGASPEVPEAPGDGDAGAGN